jgi:protein-L-isoaspartate(D-aspartate) O-methyltransferase
MTQALELNQDDRVLEIGTGSGYQAAILAQIVYRVYTIERIRSLHIQARKLFDKLHYHNIVTRYADGTKGWQNESPFNAIIVTAGAPAIPEVLVSQLVAEGRLVVPVGNQHTQELIKIDRNKNNVRQTSLGGCRFVKLVGEHGWKER